MLDNFKMKNMEKCLDEKDNTQPFKKLQDFHSNASCDFFIKQAVFSLQDGAVSAEQRAKDEV